ncbi:copper resistance CopC family protein [Aquipuribacter nitratireducens]|uniref:Copper resistance protein CopC n=1 Tax=Aquipuribacter nitratireducens TaxID=650104 RepID=A0ABW0GN22_9MICO
MQLPARAGVLAGTVLAPLLVVLGAVVAAPASAHARFTGADPAEGSSVDALPAAVVMSYSEPVSPQFVDTAVVAPGGEPVVVEASVDAQAVRVPVGEVPELAEAAASGVGEWQVVARVVSVDGHPVEHTTTFELTTAAAPAEPEPEPTTTGPDVEPSPATPGEPEPTAQTEAVSPPAATPAGSLPADPLSAATDRVPTWAGVLLALALVAAGGSAVALQWRRGRGGDQDGTHQG